MKWHCPLARHASAGLILCVIVSAAVLSAQQPLLSPGLEDLIPADGTTADVMQLGAPARLDELAKRIQKAAAKNPEWWLAHVQKAKPGQPLPYDTRLGLTKAEYEEFLALSTKMVLKKLKSAKVRVKRDGNRIVLNGDDGLPELKDIELDLKADTVRTRFGVASERSRIKASEGQKATGPWDGIQWKLEKVEEQPGSGTVVKFALGRLKESGRGILYYDVKRVSEKSKTIFTYILQYDLKATR